MAFIDSYFEHKTPDYAALKAYGFQKQENGYQYRFFLKEKTFRGELTIRNDGQIFSLLLDSETNEPYLLIDSEKAVGPFIGSLREEYETLLLDIIAHCFKNSCYLFCQSNRINALIEKTYHIQPDFPWNDERSKHFGVYRHEDRSWFGILIQVEKDKLYSGCPKTEVLNLKMDETRKEEILSLPSVYPAYHMNKKSWISIRLNDQLEDSRIMDLIQSSFELTQKEKQANGLSWVFPSNPQVYPLEQEMDCHHTLRWWKNKGNQKGDIIYLYSTKPDGCLLYRCLVTDVQAGKDENFSRELMEIKELEKYPKDKYTYAFLCQHGLKSIRGPRHLPAELDKLLKKEAKKEK